MRYGCWGWMVAFIAGWGVAACGDAVIGGGDDAGADDGAQEDVGREIDDEGADDGEVPPDVLVCETGTSCGDECVDLANDVRHCNECDRACEGALNARPICVAGECDTECLPGWADPDDDGDCQYACTPSPLPAEVCDDLDNNCDGRTDEGFACRIGTTEPCTTPCATAGTRSCSDGCSWNPCVPPSEICDGADQDCDGVADDGLYGGRWDMIVIDPSVGRDVPSFSVAVAAGEIAVGYVLASTGFRAGDAVMKRFDASGGGVGGTERLSPTSTAAALRSAGSPSVASFVWEAGAGARSDSAWIRSAVLGGGFDVGDAMQVDVSLADPSATVSVARLVSSDQAVAAWIESPMAGTPEIRLAVVADYDAPMVAWRRTLPDSTAAQPDIAVAGGDTEIRLVWRQGPAATATINHQAFSPTLAPVGAAAALASSAGGAAAPRIAANGNRYAVVWDAAPVAGVSRAIVGVGGAVHVAGIVAPGAGMVAPVVAPDRIGGFAVAYENGGNVELLRLSAAGEAAEGALRLVSGSRPEIASLPGGDLVVAYSAGGQVVRLLRVGCVP